MSASITSLDPQVGNWLLGECACFQFRKVTRLLTQRFDEVLAPTGLRSTQIVLLIGVYVHGPVGPQTLAREMAADRSTLTRNLKPLEDVGLVSVAQGEDRRTRVVQITAKGKRELVAAAPYWEQAQNAFVAMIGQETWDQIRPTLHNIVEMLQDEH